jgi:hypothetical protein
MPATADSPEHRRTSGMAVTAMVPGLLDADGP